jgi:hypothetical protein
MISAVNELRLSVEPHEAEGANETRTRTRRSEVAPGMGGAAGPERETERDDSNRPYQSTNRVRSVGTVADFGRGWVQTTHTAVRSNFRAD